MPYRLSGQLFLALFTAALLTTGVGAQLPNHDLTVSPDINEPFLLFQKYSHGPLIDTGPDTTDQHQVNDSDDQIGFEAAEIAGLDEVRHMG